jgi:hypothetical protein
MSHLINVYIAPAIVFVIIMTFVLVSFIGYQKATDSCNATNHAIHVLLAEIDSGVQQQTDGVRILTASPNTDPAVLARARDSLDNSRKVQVRLHGELAVNACG